MKRMLSSTAAGLLVLLACTACGQMPQFGSHPASAQRQTPPQNAAGNSGYSNQTYASNTADCSARANQRLAMFDRPSPYPVSDQERHDAYQALYTECVNGNTGEVAAASHNNVAANSATAAEFANLSPAAGGNYAPRGSVVNAGNTTVSTSSVPGATVVVIGGAGKDTAAQLSSLSPSSGGYMPPQNATVVLVQSPNQPAAPGNYYASATPAYYAPGAPLPVAVPVPPIAQGYMPAARPQTAPQAAVQSPAPRQPSLAGADDAATGNASQSVASQSAASQQLENILEK
jgi:hypothetical protein